MSDTGAVMLPTKAVTFLSKFRAYYKNISNISFSCGRLVMTIETNDAEYVILDAAMSASGGRCVVSTNRTTPTSVLLTISIEGEKTYV